MALHQCGRYRPPGVERHRHARDADHFEGFAVETERRRQGVCDREERSRHQQRDGRASRCPRLPAVRRRVRQLDRSAQLAGPAPPVAGRPIESTRPARTSRSPRGSTASPAPRSTPAVSSCRPSVRPTSTPTPRAAETPRAAGSGGSAASKPYPRSSPTSSRPGEAVVVAHRVCTFGTEIIARSGLASRR